MPEDRLTQGLFLEKPIADNIIAGLIGQLPKPLGHARAARGIAATIQQYFTGLRIKAPNAGPRCARSPAATRSAWCWRSGWRPGPTVLMLNGPTVGVDIGSKEEILELLRGEAADGHGR